MSGNVGSQGGGAASAAAPDLAPSPSAVGLPQGTFSADANGQATFSIPVVVPPGIAGLTPKLTLTYGHRQPNGFMGVGWSCGGLSSITRVRATYAVDGFSGTVSYGGNDRFALDGQRLINIAGEYGKPGTVYYTEMQSWSHVREMGGGFVVTAKNGTTMEYGLTADSRILAAGASEVRVWALNAIADRNGNRIEYGYTQAPTSTAPQADLGAYYPARIRYTVRQDAPARYSVDFHYETRPDPIANYIGGHPVIISSRLKQITTSVDAPQGLTNIRTYTMNYETGKATGLSRIVSITESGAALDRLAFAPARIVWQDTSTPGFDIDSPVSTLDRPESADLHPMDVTGSGRTDVVQLWLQDRVLQATTYLATPGPDGLRFVSAGDSTLDAFPETRQVMPADLDGDGRTDLLIAYQDPIDHTLKLAAYLSDGKGFTAAAGSPFDTGDPWDPASHVAFFAMDANGDGRTDLVEAYAQDGQLCFRTYLSQFGNGSGFTPAITSATNDPAHPADVAAFWAMDVNGDGMMDLVRVWRDSDSSVHATAYVSVGSAIDQVSFTSRVDTSLGVFSLADRGFLPVDVNGDGIQDLLHVWRDPDGTTLHLTTLLCNAAGGFVPGPDTALADQIIDLDHLYPMGLNGGGQVALVSPWTNTDGQRSFTIFLGSPSGTFRVLPPVPPFAAPSDARFLLGDADGNGKADLIQASTNTNGLVELVPYLSAGPCNDLASSIANAIGGTVSIQYAPLSDASVYAATAASSFPGAPGRRYPHLLTPTQFPAQSVLGQAIYVVSSVAKRDDPAANRFPYSFSFAFTYSDAQINLLGRGWQGFHQVGTTHLESGRVATQTYNQDFPYTGTVAEGSIEADGRYASDPRVPKGKTVLMGRVVTNYNAYPRSEGRIAGQQVVEVLPTSSQRTIFDYGEDNFDFQTGQSFDYDAFGNVSRHVTLGYVDRASGKPLYPDEVVYRYYQYQNDLFPQGGWALGFLRHAKTSANAVDSDVTGFLPGDLRLEQRTYTAATYNLASRARWDDSNNVNLATSYDYDEYGNCRSETAPGGFVTRCDYDPDYHVFPVSMTSPSNDHGVSLVTSLGYDPRFGVEVARREPNGSVFIRGLDGLGRKIVEQGPLPDLPGAVGDSNALTSLVTGSPELRQVFLSALTVTLETADYMNDGQGGHYSEFRSLQAFPDDTVREFLARRSYLDGLGMEREAFQPADQDDRNIVALTDYDGDGKPLQQSLPFFSTKAVVTAAPHAVSTSYDVLGRPLERRLPAGPDGGDSSTVTWTYRRNGEVTVTQAAGSTGAYVQVQEHHLYDSRNEIRRTVVPSDGNATTLFQFDRLGRLIQVTDPPTPSNPRGVTNTTTYDSLDRRLTVDNPDQNTTSDPGVKAARFAYDPVTGRLARQTNAAQQATSSAYDALGRVTCRTLFDGSSVTFTYDEGTAGLGRLTHVLLQSAAGIVQSQYVLGYDGYGNNCETSLSLEGEPSPFVTRSVFDPQRRVIQETLPDESVLVSRYAFGKLVRVQLGDVEVGYPLDRYHSTGRPGRLVYGRRAVDAGCVVVDRSFNPAGLLYRETLANGSGTILDESYAYDLLGQILRIGADGSSNPSHTFAYVNRRLTAASVPGFAPAAYDYDASGNLTAKDGVRYDFRAHFAVSGTAGGAEVYSASADACGRTKARAVKGVAQSFDYDGLGCLGSVESSDGAVLSRMLNDHRGRRLRQTNADGTTTIFVSPAYQITRAADGSLSTIRYLHDGTGPVAAVTNGGGTGTRYLRRDHKGSITHQFDTNGSLASVIGYGAYGELALLQGVAEPGPRYESRFWDAPVNLYYFGARYYDPASGRLLTPDTVVGGSSLLQAGALNRYAFELNNPILYVDPSGHWAEWETGLLIGLAAVGLGIAIIATGGLAAPALAPLAAVGLAAVGGGLLTGGLTAVTYSATHQDDFHWSTYGKVSAIGFGVGFVAGAAFWGLGAATAGMSAGAGFAVNAGVGAVINASLNVVAQFGINEVEGRDWYQGLIEAGVFGGVFGGLGAGVGGVLRMPGAPDEETIPLIPSGSVNAVDEDVAQAGRSLSTEPPEEPAGEGGQGEATGRASSNWRARVKTWGMWEKEYWLTAPRNRTPDIVWPSRWRMGIAPLVGRPATQAGLETINSLAALVDKKDRNNWYYPWNFP